MDIDDVAPSEPMRKFVEEVESAAKQLRQTIQQAIVPPSSVLEKMAEQWVIPLSQLQKVFEQAVVVQPSRLEAFAQELVTPRVLTSQFREEMEEVSQRVAEVMRQCKDGTERLANSGWTLPVHMSPGEMLEVLKETDDDAIDNEFIAFYHDGNEIPSLKRALLGSTRLKPWRPLLEQCFDNYEIGKYLICIPALVSVLEGAIALPEGAAFIRVDQRIAFFRGKIAAARPDSLNEMMWKSIEAFIVRLYEKSDFAAATRPSRLNRHWILHGRDLPEQWRRADALRLFHALSTLRTLCR